jgi:hypothetical protein
VVGIKFFKQELGHLITFSVMQGGDKTFNPSGNEKSAVISTAEMTQLCKHKLYRYTNQNNDDFKK